MTDYMSVGIPMINETNISHFANRLAIVHGKVVTIKNNILYLSYNPEKNLDIVVKNFNQNYPAGTILKIVGKMYSDQSMEFMDCYKLEQNFDLKLLNETIPLFSTPEVSPMFYSS